MYTESQYVFVRYKFTINFKNRREITAAIGTYKNK